LIGNPKEVDIQKSILDFLSHVKHCFVWRNNNVGIYDAKRKVYRLNRSQYTPNGISDILGIYRGKFLAIEVKRPKGKPTKSQSVFMDNIIKCGGIAFVATSIPDVKSMLFEIDRWLDGHGEDD